ncbi:MAG: type II secretion system F family protein [Gammaproteobacteria bacterium]
MELRESAGEAARPLASAVRERWRLLAHRGLNPRELLALTQSLAALLTAGLTIDRALQISASLATRPNARRLTETLLDHVRAGSTLSASVEASGQLVPSYYVSMVNAGEVGGSLPSTLARLAELMRRQVEVRERIRSALVYPSLLAAVVLTTLIVLLTFVLPRFETLFADSEVALPFSTMAVLATGRFMSNYWWAVAAVSIAGISGFTLWLRSSAGGARFDAWLLTSRVTLGLPAAIATARLFRTLSTLSANGLPLPSALRVARGTAGNRRLLDALTAVARDVQAGEPFSAALYRASVFPMIAVQLTRVGEETGKLDQMLLSAANVLDEEAQLRLERLLALFVPLLTVFMGLIVAGLIGSVLIGLLSINDLAF